MNKENVFELLQSAFIAQLSLTEKYRSYKEVSEILTPYFSKEYIEIFTNEHLHHDDQGYRILGADVFDYFIPFFSYNKQTNVEFNSDKIIVYEFFPASYAGGVIWDDHYKTIVLTKQQSNWIISDYVFSSQKPNDLEKLETKPNHSSSSVES